MAEHGSVETQAAPQERLYRVKTMLRLIMDIASEKNIPEVERMAKIEGFLEEIDENSDGLGLNARERIALSTLKTPPRKSSLLIAHNAAQLLGALNQESRYTRRWEEEPILIKNAFLGDVHKVLGEVIADDSVGNILKLEELISGFIFHEDYTLDSEVQQLCFDIEECIRESIHYGNELSLVRLRTKQYAVAAMRG